MARVLVIDDDLDICQLLSAFLGRKGHEVQTAGRGARAVELLREHQFDVVLCDHRLPDADSLKMLEEIRTLNPNAASIIITGYSDVRIAVELIRRALSTMS
jgi:two-component system response regulator HydG